VIIVKDAQRRQALRDLYLDGLARLHSARVGRLIPFSPRQRRGPRGRGRQAIGRDRSIQARRLPETLDQVPAMLVICADLASLAATDRDLVDTRLPAARRSIRSCGTFSWRLDLEAWAA